MVLQSIKMKKYLQGLSFEHMGAKKRMSGQSFLSCKFDRMGNILFLCSGHTSATTWNSAKSEGTASDECAWCESRKSKCLDQKRWGKRFFGQIG